MTSETSSNSLQLTRDTRGVVTLTLNRPQVHNAFGDLLISELTDALLAIADDASARALVLTGKGPSFSAGADLKWMQGMLGASEADNERDALQLARLLRALNYLPIPTIARVNGAAFGGGVGLIACCDMAVSVDGALFGLTETRLGLAPAIISPYVVRRMGEAQARRYFLSAERFDAARAQQIGLVHELCDAAQLDATVERLLEPLLKGGPRALSKSKSLVFHAAGHDEEQQFAMDQHTARLIARLRVSDEGQEGMRAFLQKRTPHWIKE